MASALELPRWIRERASMLYGEAQQTELITGRSIEALAAGSVYAACRCSGTPRTLEEIASVAQCAQSKVELGYSVLNRELGLSAQVTPAGAYIPKIVSAVDAPDVVQRRALEVAERAEAAGLTSGHHPGGVAAACVYLAGHEHGQLYTQVELAAVVDVTSTTLRNRYRELRERFA